MKVPTTHGWWCTYTNALMECIQIIAGTSLITKTSSSFPFGGGRISCCWLTSVQMSNKLPFVCSMSGLWTGQVSSLWAEISIADTTTGTLRAWMVTSMPPTWRQLLHAWDCSGASLRGKGPLTSPITPYSSLL